MKLDLFLFILLVSEKILLSEEKNAEGVIEYRRGG